MLHLLSLVYRCISTNSVSGGVSKTTAKSKPLMVSLSKADGRVQAEISYYFESQVAYEGPSKTSQEMCFTSSASMNLLRFVIPRISFGYFFALYQQPAVEVLVNIYPVIACK